MWRLMRPFAGLKPYIDVPAVCNSEWHDSVVADAVPGVYVAVDAALAGLKPYIDVLASTAHPSSTAAT
jgi:hypothetical protein